MIIKSVLKVLSGIELIFSRETGRVPDEFSANAKFFTVTRSTKKDFSSGNTEVGVFENEPNLASSDIVFVDNTVADIKQAYFYKVDFYSESARTTLVASAEVLYVPKIHALDFSVVDTNTIRLDWDEILLDGTVKYAVFKESVTGAITIVSENGTEIKTGTGKKYIDLTSTTFSETDAFVVKAYTTADAYVGQAFKPGTYDYNYLLAGGVCSEDMQFIRITKSVLPSLEFAYDSDAQMLSVSWTAPVAGIESFELSMLKEGETEYSVLSGASSLANTATTATKRVFEYIDSFNPGQLYHFKLVGRSKLGAAYNTYVVGYKKIPLPTSAAKKIIDLALGKVVVKNEYQGLNLNVAKFQNYGRMPLMYIQSTVTNTYMYPKLIRSASEMRTLISSILKNKTTAELKGPGKRTAFYELIKTLKFLQLNMDMSYYVAITSADFGTALNTPDFEEEFLKIKDIKFVYNLSGTQSKGVSYGVESVLRSLNMLYFTTDDNTFASQFNMTSYCEKDNQATPDVLPYIITSKEPGIKLPEQLIKRPVLVTPYATDFNADNLVGISNNYWLIKTSDVFDRNEISKLQELLEIEQGKESGVTDFYTSSKTVFAADVFVMTLLSKMVDKQYNENIKNKIFAWMDLTYTSAIGTENSTKPFLDMRGLGEYNSSIVDDFCGYHMTGVVKGDGKINIVVTKNEHDYLLKYLHVKLAVMKIQETMYQLLERLARENRIKTRNIGLIETAIKSIWEKSIENGLFMGYDKDSFSIDIANVTDDSGVTRETLVINAKFIFELGIREAHLNQVFTF